MIIAIILLDIMFSIMVASIGKNRKFGFWGYLFASFLLTPIVGALLVLASDPIKSDT